MMEPATVKLTAEQRDLIVRVLMRWQRDNTVVVRNNRPPTVAHLAHDLDVAQDVIDAVCMAHIR